ncbi:MAG TPA: DUF262 domain-containing protein [Frateuria sp.]|uniref:DUF262 domain-containing protein n=1 Tax=Frateuria sp. TaxID=2211372 RepID=UPI002DF27AE0|nr:DUF262 domain-containing protein [Frateuria sp.]
MNMTVPTRSSYTVSDFVDWSHAASLIISPKFQRRGVWKTPAKSYLIDTIIKGYPVPPIYIRVGQSLDKKKTIREVVDGQQRITSVLDYVRGRFALSKSVVPDYAGQRFDDLPGDVQDRIRNYSFICEVFLGISDDQVLEIFRRVNTYSVALNNQELRNGRWFGEFKETAYALASKYLTFWRNNKIFSEQKIARMAEVELTSELLIVLIDGVQDKKKSIDSYYERFDETFPDREKIVKRFERVIAEIGENCPSLSDTAFSRPPLFYSLFAALAHRLYGVSNMSVKRKPTSTLSSGEAERLEVTLIALTEVIESSADGSDLSEREAAFVAASQRQTDNIKPRMTVIKEVYQRTFH